MFMMYYEVKIAGGTVECIWCGNNHWLWWSEWGRAQTGFPRGWSSSLLGKPAAASGACTWHLEGDLYAAGTSPLWDQLRGFPWRSAGNNLALPQQGAWVQSLGRDLRSCMPWAEPKKKKAAAAIPKQERQAHRHHTDTGWNQAPSLLRSACL